MMTDEQMEQLKELAKLESNWILESDKEWISETNKDIIVRMIIKYIDFNGIRYKKVNTSFIYGTKIEKEIIK